MDIMVTTLINALISMVLGAALCGYAYRKKVSHLRARLHEESLNSLKRLTRILALERSTKIAEEQEAAQHNRADALRRTKDYFKARYHRYLDENEIFIAEKGELLDAIGELEHSNKRLQLELLELFSTKDYFKALYYGQMGIAQKLSEENTELTNQVVKMSRECNF